jgi:hypothetical protein
MLWLYGVALYGLVGSFIAACIAPLSWPFRRNALVLMLVWPWPITAWAVWLVTGRYPRWGAPPF